MTYTTGILDWPGTSLIVPGIGTTIDSARLVSNQTDYLGLINAYTQATDANKFVLSRADNKENVFLYSEQFNNAWWIKSLASISADSGTDPIGGTTADTLVEDATASNAHYLNSTVRNFVNGQVYNLSFYFKPAGRNRVRVAAGDFNRAPVDIYFDVSTGTVVSSPFGTGSITSVGGGWYRCHCVFTSAQTGITEIYVMLVSSGTTSIYNGDGVSGILLWGGQLRTALADSAYLPTTTAPQYRGANGRQGLYSSGVQFLSSGVLLSALFSASSGIIYAVVRADLLGSEHQITRASTSSQYALRTKSSSAFYFINSDGTARYSETPATAATNNLYVLRARHSGGNIYCAIDSGSGFVEGAAVACGNSAALTGTMNIGAAAGTSLYGTIFLIATHNIGDPLPAYENDLRRFFFTQSTTQSSNIRIADNNALQEALSVSSSGTLETGHDVYSVISSKRSNWIQRSAAATSNTVTATFRSGNEQACNYLIVTKAARLKAAGCTGISLQYSNNNVDWYTYLEDLTLTSLVGEFQQDLFLFNNTSSLPYQYWRVVFTGSSNKFPIANIYFGMLFDYGRDPDKIDWRPQVDDTSKESTKGDVFAARMSKPQHKFSFEFYKIEDSKVLESRRFVDKAHYLPVFVVTTSDHSVMQDFKCVHCEATDYKVMKRANNYNEVKLEIEELLK